MNEASRLMLSLKRLGTDARITPTHVSFFYLCIVSGKKVNLGLRSMCHEKK